ncbi:MAG: DUF952 domain-containing protein [Gemmatimonadaceae bacterium]|nr:DUF952 domain-containing protein [Acetobacteraceae bacterium]
MILHITSAEAWAEAQGTGQHAPPMLAADGFLHFCTPSQLDYVLGKHFAGRTNLVMLHVDPAKLDDLRWETSVPGRDAFPHLYGPLPVAAVMRAEPIP